MVERVALRLPLARDAELRAVEALDRMLAQYPVEQRAAGQVRFALIEACLNAMEYTDSAREFNVAFAIDGNELRITVENDGAFQAKPSGPRRGHGLKIIHSFMDRVRYLTDSRGTRVEMVKRLNPSHA